MELRVCDLVLVWGVDAWDLSSVLLCGVGAFVICVVLCCVVDM